MLSTKVKISMAFSYWEVASWQCKRTGFPENFLQNLCPNSFIKRYGLWSWEPPVPEIYIIESYLKIIYFIIPRD
jgi:hypothetical protein